MDWTWSLDWLVAVALAVGSVGGALATTLWWTWGGIWFLRSGAIRAALLLPYGLAWGVGEGSQPLAMTLLFVLWLGVESIVPLLLRAWGKAGAALDPVPAAAAATGALACGAILHLGPLLPESPSVILGLMGALPLFGGLLGATVSAFVLWRRTITSPVARAGLGAGLVLAFDGLYLTPGGLTVLFLAAPVLLHLTLGFVAALRRRWPASARRFATAGVWLLALAGLVAFSRFNLHLAERRSDLVIAACHHFEDEHGRLPASLEDLVPDYLPRVPRADWTVLGSFRYQPGPSPELVYFAPWPQEVVYSFATGQRRIRSPASETTPVRAPESRLVSGGIAAASTLQPQPQGAKASNP